MRELDRWRCHAPRNWRSRRTKPPLTGSSSTRTACAVRPSSSYPIRASSCRRLRRIWPELAGIDERLAERLATDARYSVYLERQKQDIDSFEREESAAASSGPPFRDNVRAFKRAAPKARAGSARNLGPGEPDRGHDARRSGDLGAQCAGRIRERVLVARADATATNPARTVGLMTARVQVPRPRKRSLWRRRCGETASERSPRLMFHVKHWPPRELCRPLAEMAEKRSISSRRPRSRRLWTRHILDSRANRRSLGAEASNLGRSRLRRRFSRTRHRDPGRASGRSRGSFHLVESDQRKASFLREAARVTGRARRDPCRRAEDVLPELRGRVTAVTARALAPLRSPSCARRTSVDNRRGRFLSQGRDAKVGIAAGLGDFRVREPSGAEPKRREGPHSRHSRSATPFVPSAFVGTGNEP